ncbi:MAG: hypothetical protein H3C43_03635 [Leptonema sp. (in: Bacteria)]|nr:hypothetical protein [Leptonema sp. (in: bacteria)]
MNQRIKSISFILFWSAVVVIGTWVVWWQYQTLYQVFLSACVNKDTLVWDANIRFIQAIDFVDDFKSGIYLPGISSLIASPTWPPLRTIFSILLIWWHGSPDPVIDILPSVVFLFGVVWLYFGFVVWYTKTRILDITIRAKAPNRVLLYSILTTLFFSLVFFTTLFLILGVFDLPAYIFSSMLEIQGMFFFTWNGWSIYSILKSKRTVSKFVIWSFFLSGVGLYLTKYPYGILTGLSLIAICMLKSPVDFWNASRKVLIERYKGWHLIPLVLLILALVIVVLGPHLGTELVNTKAIKRFLYIALLLVFIDFNHYLYKRRPNYFSTELKIFYLYFILPFAIVLLSHPDRFGSLIQAQTDTVPGGSRFYPVALFAEYFMSVGPLIVIVLGGILILLVSIFLQKKSWHSLLTGEQSIEWLMTIFVWCNIFIMQFMTSNHQSRYLLQIFPLFLFFHSSMFLYLFRSKNKSNGLTRLNWPSFVLPVLIFVSLPFFAIKPLFTKDRLQPVNICFAATDPTPVQEARELAASIPKSSRAIVVNDCHEVTAPLFARAQATEIDLFLRYRTWGSGIIRNDSKYRYKTWQDSKLNFNEVIHVSYECGDNESTSNQKLIDRANQVGANLKLEAVSMPKVNRQADQNQEKQNVNICLYRYRIE